MIQANELRIGNYVLFCTEIDTVTEISISDSGYCKNQGFFNLDKGYIEPIPITPEILEKTNAIKDNYGLFYFRRGGLIISESGMDVALIIKNCLVDGDWVWDCSIGEIENIFHLRYIQYLHELQNLYFALTGQELTYNP